MNRARATFGLVVIGKTETVSFDATLQETHSVEYSVTRHEVESGAPIGEHVRQQPRELQFVVATSAVGIEVLEGSAVLAVDDREFAVVRALERLAARREIVTLRCYLGRYEGYLVESIQTSVAASDGSSLAPTVRFVQYRQIQPQSVEVPAEFAEAVRAIAEQEEAERRREVTPVDEGAAAPDGANALDLPAGEEEREQRSVLASIDEQSAGSLTNTIGRGLETLGVVSAGGVSAP